MKASHSQEPGIVLLILSTGFKFILGIFLAWLISLLLGSICAAFLSLETLLNYTTQLKKHELNSLSRVKTSTWLIKQPDKTAVHLAQTIHNTTKLKIPFTKGLKQLKQQEQEKQEETPNVFFKYLLKKWLPAFLNYVHLWITLTEITVIRLLNIIMALPLFGLLGTIGFIDGIGQRTLRRLQGARESMLLYHKARLAIAPSLMGGCFLYLLCPTPISAMNILLPFAIAFGLSVSIATRLFRKYL